MVIAAVFAKCLKDGWGQVREAHWATSPKTHEKEGREEEDYPESLL